DLDVRLERNGRRADVLVACEGFLGLFEALGRQGVLVELLPHAGAADDLSELFTLDEGQHLVDDREAQCKLGGDLPGGRTAAEVDGFHDKVEDEGEVEAALLDRLW